MGMDNWTCLSEGGCCRAVIRRRRHPGFIGADPYGEGWLIILKPDDWNSVKGGLVAGSQVAGPYEAKMAADGFAGCA